MHVTFRHLSWCNWPFIRLRGDRLGEQGGSCFPCLPRLRTAWRCVLCCDSRLAAHLRRRLVEEADFRAAQELFGSDKTLDTLEPKCVDPPDRILGKTAHRLIMR